MSTTMSTTMSERDERGPREGANIVDDMEQSADATVIPLPRPPAIPKLLDRSDWQIVYQVQESSEESAGLSVHSDIAVRLPDAMALADERAGRFAATAGNWFKDAGAYSRDYHPWTREVPGLGWQHITPVHLYGAQAPR